MGKVLLFRGGNRMPNIIDVANYFLKRSQEGHEFSMTPLKLQKLAYYAQAWSLVWDGQPIFEEDFQAWVHGPANYRLYKKYEIYYRNEPILGMDKSFNENIFSQCQKETLSSVWDIYGHYSGQYLEELTHVESPWLDARQGLNQNDGSDRIITKNTIHEYYSKFYNI